MEVEFSEDISSEIPDKRFKKKKRAEKDQQDTTDESVYEKMKLQRVLIGKGK